MTDTVVVPSKTELLAAIGGDEGTVEEVIEQAELSPREQQAADQGWQPEADWVAAGKDPKHWRPADVWLDRGEFFKTISSLKTELNATKQQVAAAFETGKKMAEQAAKEQIAELKVERREAMREGDFDKVDKLDDRIDTVKENLEAKTPVVPEQIQVPPEYHVFISRNPWYNADPVLRYAADGIGYEFARVNRTASNAELYQFVEIKIREKFPEQFKGGPKSPPSPDSRGTSTRGTEGTATKGDKSLGSLKANMTEEQRGIMKTLIQTKVFKNEAEYLSEFAKAPVR